MREIVFFLFPALKKLETQTSPAVWGTVVFLFFSHQIYIDEISIEESPALLGMCLVEGQDDLQICSFCICAVAKVEI